MIRIDLPSAEALAAAATTLEIALVGVGALIVAAAVAAALWARSLNGWALGGVSFVLSQTAQVVVLFLFGPNLGSLGTRDPARYGTQTLAEIMEAVGTRAATMGHEVTWRQSDVEGDLLGWIRAARGEGFAAIVANPGALSHYSLALRDAVEAAQGMRNRPIVKYLGLGGAEPGAVARQVGVPVELQHRRAGDRLHAGGDQHGREPGASRGADRGGEQRAATRLGWCLRHGVAVG